MLKFKKGDKVKITAGKDKGREAEIETILFKERLAIVPGVNLYKKHVKGVPGQKGGIYDIPRPLPFSKFMLVCPNCKKTTRVGFIIEGKEKIRVCKKCGKEIANKSKN